MRMFLWRSEFDINSKTSESFAPLRLAVSSQQEDIVQMLLDHDGVDVNAKSRDGVPILLRAVRKGAEEIVRSLLDHKDVNVNAGSPEGVTSLMIAAEQNLENIILLLLSRQDMDVNAKVQRTGMTAWLFAAACGNTKIVQLFLDRRDVDFTAVNGAELSALELTVGAGRLECAKALLDKGLTRYCEAVSRHSYGLKVLRIAVRWSSKDMVNAIQQHGVNFDWRDDNAIEFFDAALQSSKPLNKLSLLFDHGAHNISRKAWYKILSQAVDSRELVYGALELLISRGADIVLGLEDVVSLIERARARRAQDDLQEVYSLE